MKNMSAHNIAKTTLKRSERTYLEDGELNRQNGGIAKKANFGKSYCQTDGSDGIGDLKRREDNGFQPLKV
ncbi:hypothetical protein PVK06_003956 [Gossypium arboreum]|uniref:Uncharacterized protein n=1 Tax=Gossypium arboreum TaxID=29729 RepID=A0ABR0QQP7_GOSAR|nr:hypothetical protein PVK06_003956 [Gossypium arboreum]